MLYGRERGDVLYGKYWNAVSLKSKKDGYKKGELKNFLYVQIIYFENFYYQASHLSGM